MKRSIGSHGKKSMQHIMASTTVINLGLIVLHTDGQIKTKFTSISIKTELVSESFHIFYTQVSKRWHQKKGPKHIPRNTLTFTKLGDKNKGNCVMDLCVL